MSEMSGLSGKNIGALGKRGIFVDVDNTLVDACRCYVAVAAPSNKKTKPPS
jgi:hypothetical protein